jgi:hypothetical protein
VQATEFPQWFYVRESTEGNGLEIHFLQEVPKYDSNGLHNKGCIITEEFCESLHHFNHHRPSGRAFLIFDVCQAHLDSSVLTEAQN